MQEEDAFAPSVRNFSTTGKRVRSKIILEKNTGGFMRYQSNRSTSIVRAAAVAAVALFATSAGAVAETQLKGQWNGTSQLRGESSTAKTFLSLGAPDDESATLRLEGRTNCSLRDGKYSAD